ncbi:uncharacterized protein BDV17DRAFT_80638 [Aspergillus undulatus]|uniref:uncharacterized protein n=1 Tax=Aspergillus undulatus TaxID=1810928 RepID=UPI003CCC92FF
MRTRLVLLIVCRGTGMLALGRRLLKPHPRFICSVEQERNHLILRTVFGGKSAKPRRTYRCATLSHSRVRVWRPPTATNVIGRPVLSRLPQESSNQKYYYFQCGCHTIMTEEIKDRNQTRSRGPRSWRRFPQGGLGGLEASAEGLDSSGASSTTNA